MSHIFDALQRSEDERSGVDSPEQSEVTELLRRAERRAASKWEATVRRKGNHVSEGAERNESLELQVSTPESGLPQEHALEESPSRNSRADVIPEFQPMPVVLEPQSRLVCFDDNGSVAEAFRLLGVRLRLLRRDRLLKKLLITSTIPGEGKSMVAANLACALALTTQQKVLLLEGDLRKPSLSGIFGVGRNPGLYECLQGERTLASSIYRLEIPSLWLLPSGYVEANPLELLQSGKLPAIMDQLTAWFDWIIVDSPPVLPLADTSVWTRLTDGILLVTRQGITDKRHLLRGLEALEPKKMIGAVVNCSSNSANSEYYYGTGGAPRPKEGRKK